MPDDRISRTSSITSLIRNENFQDRKYDFLGFVKDVGLSQDIWGGFSAARRQSSVSISAIRPMKINQLTNRQRELGKEENTHKGQAAKLQRGQDCVHGTVSLEVCHLLGHKKRKLGFWSSATDCARKSQWDARRKTSTQLQKSCVSYSYLLCFSSEQLLLWCTNMIAAFSVTTASTASHVSKHE